MPSIIKYASLNFEDLKSKTDGLKILHGILHY